MQVTHVSDHITHAVIGGKKAIDFGISDDPAFFNILSSSLYKDPILAMVRETLCNAWDAHIEAGLTHKALTVTLNDDYLIIQDFGTGIHDSMIGPIYAIYGASTKKADSRSTGGFGLGCKSPFAYNDHFEVTSCHNDIKTIYNMSKSSAESNGKPSVTPIASFPTKESGITVKIPLNPEKQNHRLEDLIKEVAFNGDIKVSLNNGELPILGLDHSEHGLVLIPRELNSNYDFQRGSVFHKSSRISVRYGNVIYPVENNEGYAELYQQVDGLLRNHYEGSVILMASPDSLSITPSREALNLSDNTIETIQSLLGKFLSIFIKNQQMLFRHKELVNEYIDAAALQETALLAKLPLTNWHIPGVPRPTGEKVLSTTDEFAKLEVAIRYTKDHLKISPKKWLGYMQRYLYKINEQKLFDQGKLQSWARTFQRNFRKISNPGVGYYVSSQETKIATLWWQKNVLTPLILSCKEHITYFNKEQLYFHSQNSNTDDESYNSRPKPKLVKKVTIINHTHNIIHVLKPTVILTHNAEHTPSRIKALMRSDYPNGTFQQDTYFIYEIGRKRETLEKAREQFAALPGIEFIDVTIRLPNEQVAYEERQALMQKEREDRAAGRPVKTKLIKKVTAGMVCLTNLIPADRNRVDTRLFSTLLEPVKVEKPEAVMLVSTGKEYIRCTKYFNEEQFIAIVKLYGEKVGISNKSDAIERAIEKGAMNINEYVFSKIMHDIENLPSLLAYHACDPTKIKNYIGEKAHWNQSNQLVTLVDILMTWPELNHLVPDVEVLSEEDQYRWTLWKAITSFCNYEQCKEVYALEEKNKLIPLKPEIITFLDKLIANPFVALIDTDGTKKLIRSTKESPIDSAKLMTLLTTILT